MKKPLTFYEALFCLWLYGKLSGQINVSMWAFIGIAILCMVIDVSTDLFYSRLKFWLWKLRLKIKSRIISKRTAKKFYSSYQNASKTTAK